MKNPGGDVAAKKSSNAWSLTKPDAAPADSDTIHVQIVNATSSGFQPSSVTVKPNGVVLWHNISAVTHTVTSD